MTHTHITTLLISIIFSFGYGHVYSQNIEAIVQMGHSKIITASDISPDGQYIATGSIDRSIIIWEAKTGKEIRILHHHVKSVIALHFSMDGKTILSASNDNTVKLSSVETGEVLHTFIHTEYDITNAVFNGNGTKIIIFDKRDHFSVWDSHSGELEGYFTKDYAAYNDINTVSFNGEKVLSKIDNKTVACISLITKDTLFTMEFDNAYTLNFTADEAFIVIGSAKLFATVFDGETGDSLHTVKTNGNFECNGCKTNIAISKDSKYVYSMSNKGVGLLWHTKTGKIIKKLTLPEKWPDNISLGTDAKKLLINFDDDIYGYDLTSGTELFHLINKNIDYYELKLKNDLFIMPGTNNAVDLWSFDRQKTTKTYSGYLNQARSDGLRFDYSVWIDASILQYISFKTSFALHPNNSDIILSKVDSSAVILNLKTGKKTHTLSDASKANLCQAYSKDGKWLAIAGGDRKIRVYDTETYQLKHTLIGHKALIFDLQFSDNSNELVSGGWDGLIFTWDIAKEQWTQYIDFEKDSPYIVRYSPKNLYIVSGDLNKNIVFWENDTKEKFRTLIGHTGPISSIIFSSDGTQLLTASWDGKIKLWHTLTGMQLAKFNEKGAPIYSAIFSRDQKQIISGDGDRKIKFWDIATGDITLELHGHISAVTDIKITSDGKLMISRGANGEIIVWDYVTKKQIYTYMQINRNDWLVTAPSGHFDGSKAALELVNYVSGMEVVRIESLFDKFYTPGLAKRMMAGEKLNDSGSNFKALISNRPELAFQIPNSKTRSTVVQNDSSVISKTATFSIDVVMVENSSDVSQIKVYNNGKLIETEFRDKNLVFRGEKEYAKTFNITLIDGINEIKAVAVSNERVESDPIRMTVSYDGEAAKTDLYILSIGINQYKNSNYNLSYAVKDAADFSKTLSKGGESLFNKVYNYSIENAQANKTEIEAAFKQLIEQVG
ncbi:MAG: WD40 repeat domain-containing protein, partial [Putridiphycobacter sp.]|nr:WD40 repeat domain-containing protein [Putridiphycobacter sp.]